VGDDQESPNASDLHTAVPALPAWLIEPVWDQFAALLPEHHDTHPLGCHRPTVPDRIIFNKLIQVLVFGCAYERIADHTCSARTLRRRRDDWITAGIMAWLERIVRDAYDRMISLNSPIWRWTGASPRPHAAARSPGTAGGPRQAGPEPSVASDSDGIPLGWVVAPAKTPDSPLLAPTLEALAGLGPRPPSPRSTWTQGHDSATTRTTLAKCGLDGHIAHRARPPPSRPASGDRWSAPTRGQRVRQAPLAPKRRRRVVEFHLAPAHAIIIVRRLVRRAWTCYRWQARPGRRP
jgi:hypothetical protein